MSFAGRVRVEAPRCLPLRRAASFPGFGVQRIVELDWWNSADVHGIRIAATPARHFSARRVGDRNRTLWCGFALQGSGRRCYFAGDSAYHPEFSEIGARYGPFDLVGMPVGAYDPRWFMQRVHVNPEEAVQACLDLASAHRGGPARGSALDFRVRRDPRVVTRVEMR